jgi:hypothetical protein
MIVSALAELHGIAPDDVPALRSRFGVFQRGGLLGKPPGRGVRVQYFPDELHRVVFAFEMAQLNISPTTVLWLVREFWDQRLREIFMRAERANINRKPNVVLFLSGLTAMNGPEEAIPNINATTIDKLSESFALAIRGEEDDDPPARAVAVNLSSQLARFHKALTRYHLRPEMLAELEAQPKSKSRRAAKPRRR